MKKFSFTWVALWMFFSTVLSAEALSTLSGKNVDLDTPVGSEDADGSWTFKVSGGYDIRSGNTETESVNGAVEAQRLTDHNHFRAAVQGAYAEQTLEDDKGGEYDDRTVGNAKGEMNYKMIWGANFIYVDFTAFHDDIAELKYRLMESVGVGRYLIKEDTLTFSLQGGLACVQEELDEKEEYLAFRLAERLEWKPVFAEGVSFFESAEGLLDAGDSDRYLASAEAGIDIPLFADFALTFKFVYNYNSMPAEGKDSSDRQFLTQISYQF